MKTKAILLLICICFFLQAPAQEIRPLQSPDTLKNSIFIGYGLATFPELQEAALSAMLYLVTFGIASQKEVHASGVFFVGYEYAVTNNLTAGGTLAFEKISGTTQTIFSQKKSSFTDNYYSILVGIKYNYNFAFKNFRFYGRADAGLLLNTSFVTGTDEISVKKTYSRAAFQLSPVCFRVGRKICGFCELGFGQLGLINAGLEGRF